MAALRLSNHGMSKPLVITRDIIFLSEIGIPQAPTLKFWNWHPLLCLALDDGKWMLVCQIRQHNPPIASY